MSDMAQSPQPDEQQQRSTPPANGAGRFIGGVFGVAFAGIGLTVVISLWAGGMGDPPTFFKLIGSFMGLLFVAVGGALAFSAITGRGMMSPPRAPDGTMTATASSSPATPGGGYTCPHCGGGLDRGADVSPMGDVKCSFCGRWFNVHGRS
jgi:hypothetical protein